jgi:hypothetical protein
LRLLIEAHETDDSKTLEKPVCFSSFPDDVGFFVEGKIEYSVANLDKVFVSLGKGYRRMKLECFLNGAAVCIEVPIGSHGTPEAMKRDVGNAVGPLDAFVTSGTLDRLASLSNDERRVMVFGDSHGRCSIAVYPPSLIYEGGSLIQKLFMSRHKDVKYLNDVFLGNIPFEELSK